jgi:long-chain acyl-CoA synthetase
MNSDVVIVTAVERPLQILKNQGDGGVTIVQGNQIREIDIRELERDVDKVIAYLRNNGLISGDRVGIRGPNSYQWLVLDLALISLGCVSVCVPPEASDFDSIPVESLMEMLDLTAFFQGAFKNTAPESGATDLAAILDDSPPRITINARKSWRSTTHSDDVFTVVFSSGSTGRLKRLPLSWSSIKFHVDAFGKAFGLTTRDRILVVLPFSIFQQRYLVYCAIWHGCRVVLSRPEDFLNVLRHGKATVILGPPNFYEIVEQRFNLRPAWQRRLMLRLAKAADVLPDKLRRAWRAMVFHSFHKLYGGAARILLVGSAPIKRGTLELFRLGGFPLYQCYGMTEAGWIAWNGPGSNKIGTVGKPAFPGTVKIAEDGEVIISRSWNQCASYETFGDETAESGVFLGENTIATGDIGEFDADGHLTLVGRKKNVIVTLGGLKVSPEEIEGRLAALPIVRHAIIFDHPSMPSIAAAIWTRDETADEKRMVLDALKTLNSTSLRRTPVLGVVFPEIELSAENGLLTRNLKIDRSGVRAKLQSDVLPLNSVQLLSENTHAMSN